jgi:heme-degrading monooxygenase HmoA
MYIAMNRFKVSTGKEEMFESLWKERKTRLSDVSGFETFNLTKGAQEDHHTLYASHSTWHSREAFESWTKSRSLKDSHRDAGKHWHLYVGHPVFEGFEVII